MKKLLYLIIFISLFILAYQYRDNIYEVYYDIFVSIEDKKISLLTHHGFPYRRFNSTPEDNEKVFIEFDNYINIYKPDIITGDFNSENFIEMMPYTKSNYIKTIDEPTTDDGKKFDNILLKNNNYTSKVVESLSDHLMVVDTIEL